MFGAYAPLPLRLGDEFSATQHARIAADLVAAKRTCPFAVITIDIGASSATLVSYTGRNGSGADAAPTLLYVAGEVQLTWDKSWLDEYEREHVVNIGHLDPSVSSTTLKIANAYKNNANTVTVGLFTAAGSLTTGRVTLVVYGSTDARIDHYDGSTDKHDSATEGQEPYAWLWYREFQNMRGSAYSRELYGTVHAENLVIARQFAAVSRAAEKFEANQLPGTADERLESWQKILGVPTIYGDTRWDVRRECEAHYRVTLGNTQQSVDDAVQELLGDTFVSVTRTIGSDLDTPPSVTEWPGVNPGSSDYDMGGGAWKSVRAHYSVTVQQPVDLNDGSFHRLVRIKLYRLLDRVLPCWATFDWNTSDGFVVDESEFDFDGV